MNTTESQSTPPKFHVAKLIERIKLVLLAPNECWSTIANETTSPKELAINLVAPLVIAGSLCTFLGTQLLRPYVPFFSNLILQIVTVVLQIGGTFLAALIIQKFSPQFNGSDDYNRAYSLLAHSMIPSLLAEFLGRVPLFLPLQIPLSGFAIYLLYAGTTKMLNIPDEKRAAFVAAVTVATMVAISVVWIVIGGMSAGMLGI